MTDAEQQWLLCLSTSSLLGAKSDIDALSAKGFYKKPDKFKTPLDLDVGLENPIYKKNEPIILAFLTIFEIEKRQSFYQKLDHFIEGSAFAKNMNRLMQVGKAMDEVEREKKETFVINGHPYLHEGFQVLMTYEFHWPKHGLRSYDLANALMLIRLGSSLGYMDEEAQLDYLLKINEALEPIYETSKSFGESAEIGRQIHCKYLKSMGMGKELSGQNDVFSMVYYSVWKNIMHLWPKDKG